MDTPRPRALPLRTAQLSANIVGTAGLRALMEAVLRCGSIERLEFDEQKEVAPRTCVSD